MANFIIPYTTPANYTFDNSVIEVDSGLAKLKKLTSDDETFYANYNTDINGNRGLGVLTGIPIGGASVGGGKLDLAHDDLRYVDYDAVGNADSQQTGCIRFKITPNYSGNPSSTQYFFAIHSVSDYNLITFYHWLDGTTYLYIKSSVGVNIMFAGMGVWNPTASQEYEFELNYDITNGITRIFIDGTQFGATQTGTGTRDIISGNLIIGTSFSMNKASNFQLDDFQVFSTVQHTANYIPCSCPESTYCCTKPTIYKTLGDGVANIEEFISFAETLGSGNQGSVRYQLSVDGINWLYWNGTVWDTASATDYNTVAECEAHMLDFDATDDKIYTKAFLISDGIQKVELDENQVGYVINTAPFVYAGLNKSVIYNITMNPFSDCLFSDAEGNIVKAEWKEEGGSYVEILQGAYSSLLEAVREFQYTPAYSGSKDLYLKITDSYDAHADDVLTITVTQVNVNITIKDSNGNHLSNVTFDAGDSSNPSAQNSPFAFVYDIGTFTSVLSKIFFNALSEVNTISIATIEIDYVMERETRIDELVCNVDAPREYVKGDTLTFNGVIDINLTGYKIRCDITDVDDNQIKLATTNSGGSDAEINIFNPASGNFAITVAKNLTASFADMANIEIEIENASGQIRTILKVDVPFRDENLDWESSDE